MVKVKEIRTKTGLVLETIRYYEDGPMSARAIRYFQSLGLLCYSFYHGGDRTPYGIHAIHPKKSVYSGKYLA